MAISKARREELLSEYVEMLEKSRAIFLTEYTALSVRQMEALRAEVRKADGAFHVTKNTLLRLALEQAGKPVPDDLLQGQTATGFALGEVPGLAKAFVDFAKTDEKLSIKGGIMGPNLLTKKQVEDLANLPSLDQLRAQIIGLINAPAQNVTSVVAGGVRQIMNVLDAYTRQQEEGVEAAA